MRFVRQEKPMDWDPVFAKANEILLALCDAKRNRNTNEDFSSEQILNIVDSIL